MKGLRFRLALSLVVFVAAVLYALPNLPAVANSPLGKYLPDARINLGLDLKGGMNLTLGVDMKKAVQSNLIYQGQSIRALAAEKKISVLKPGVTEDERLELTLPKAEQAAEFQEILSKSFPELVLEGEKPGPSGGLIYSLVMTDAARTQMESLTLDQVVRTIRNRIDQFGVAEPDIRTQSGNQVQVQLPGLTDPERAIQIVGQTAHLEFHLVRDDVDANGLKLPAGTAIYPEIVKGANGETTNNIVLDVNPLMSGEHISDARPQFGQDGTPNVSLTFNAQGARDFERITRENTRKRMAIVLDGKVYSAPVINEPISGGRASISGRFTTAEANDLAIVLRAGSLPAPVTILEERTVGPSLGQASINSGILAAVVGALAVVVIMPLYYGLSGFIADVMLFFTMTLVVAGMTSFGATLTLPGIAGIVLTIGMAVDANVLIYERIREELKNGLTPPQAVEEGFNRASTSIIDSNITTIIAAAILYQFGTGPIRGFAITLTMGILASMFTAVFVSRGVFNVWMARNGGKSINI